MASPIIDCSDLLAEISVNFRLLNHFEPDAHWGWHHPVLVEWMTKYGFQSRHCLTWDALTVVNKALKLKYAEFERVETDAIAAQRGSNG